MHIAAARYLQLLHMWTRPASPDWFGALVPQARGRGLSSHVHVYTNSWFSSSWWWPPLSVCSKCGRVCSLHMQKASIMFSRHCVLSSLMACLAPPPAPPPQAVAPACRRRVTTASPSLRPPCARSCRHLHACVGHVYVLHSAQHAALRAARKHCPPGGTWSVLREADPIPDWCNGLASGPWCWRILCVPPVAWQQDDPAR